MGIIEWLLEKPRRDYFDNITSNSAENFNTASSTSKRHEVNIFNMRVGDYVTYESTDYFVRQRYLYKAGSFEWIAYQFSDSAREKYLWLDVEDDDELCITMSQPIKLPPGINIEHLKSRKPVKIDGENFQYDEHGYAQVKIEKENNRWDSETVKYWDYYNDNDSKFLSFELWGSDELEASLGVPIKDYQLDIYPGS